MRIEDFDSPLIKRQFRLGINSTAELTGYLAAPENLHKAILIYSGPNYANGSVTVTIQLNDDKQQTIQLVPIADSPPYYIILEK